MRLNGISLLAACLFAFSAIAELKPETVGSTKMQKPGDTWFLVQSDMATSYIFDAETGNMHGLLSTPFHSPAVEVNLDRDEIYAAESYFSRGVYGERTDIVNIYDLETLSPMAEIAIPKKVAALPFRRYIGLLDDKKHLVIFNLTPAQSVSVVDIEKRMFVSEIKTPGCSLIMPTSNRTFLQICGDGTLQSIQLDKNGIEIARLRSEVFFELGEDPVFDKPIPTEDGWLLTSYEGKVWEAISSKDKILISDSWSFQTEEEKTDRWRPGGGQHIAFHRGKNLIFVLMHQGEVDSHEESGSEVWVFDRGAERRIAKIVLEVPARDLLVSQNEDPLLTVTGTDSKLHVFNVKKAKLTRSIELPGPGLLQAFR